MKIIDLIEQNNDYRSSCLNMIVSENILSSDVKKALSLQHSRYHAEIYGGTELFRQIYTQTEALTKRVFRCNSAFISPLSGNMSLLAVIHAFTQLRDKVAILPLASGGYPLNISFFGRKKVNIPFNTNEFNIDLTNTLEMLEREKPKLVCLGASLILFPQPVQAISQAVHDYGGVVAYDGSHVLGLIAGGQFQDPLKEGADLLLGSTHKSFPGPQGGLVLSNGFHDEKLDEVIGIDPLEGIVFVDNIHNSRIAALGVALEEFQKFGHEYARQVIKNSKTLARTLDLNEIPLHGKFKGFTNSHQVLMQIKDYEEGRKFRDALLEYKIVTDGLMRFGTAELTRIGFGNEEMQRLGNIIAKIVHHSSGTQPLPPEKLNEIKEQIETLLAIIRRKSIY
ncbi:MAG: hypothetical protein ACFFC7_27440 [Candidatus Hermodarchaeota archaeon]